MNWKKLSNKQELNTLTKESFQGPVLIYKHSTRCSLSDITRSRLERSWKADPLGLSPYFLDLVLNRDVSDAVEHQFQVRHQSPQVLVIDQGKCIFQSSHLSISHRALKDVAQAGAIQKSNWR